MSTYNYYLLLIAPAHGVNIECEYYRDYQTTKNRAKMMRDQFGYQVTIYGVNTDCPLASICPSNWVPVGK